MVGSNQNVGESWRIVAKRLPIGEGTPLLDKLAGHMYVQILDENNKVVAQIDGLAVGKDGRLKPVGEASDLLQVEVFNNLGGDPNKQPIWNNHANHESTVLYETNNIADVEKAIAQFEITAQQINEKRLNYNLLGNGNGNSNSVFNDVTKDLQSALQIPDARIQAAKDMGLSNPGVDNSVLYQQKEESSQEQNFFTPIVNGVKHAINFVAPYIANGVFYAIEGLGFASQKIAEFLNPDKAQVAQQPEQPKPAVLQEAEKLTTHTERVLATNGFVPPEDLPNLNAGKSKQIS
jgi:hypothetical protein